MFLRLSFSQLVIRKVMEDQGINFPCTLASLSDRDITIIGDMNQMSCKIDYNLRCINSTYVLNYQQWKMEQKKTDKNGGAQSWEEKLGKDYGIHSSASQAHEGELCWPMRSSTMLSWQISCFNIQPI